MDLWDFAGHKCYFCENNSTSTIILAGQGKYYLCDNHDYSVPEMRSKIIDARATVQNRFKGARYKG
uniref:Uncharacterized protein n=1 Tax=Marseillevirus LCMAC201 TaxID=2506605 RepID=A0A481YWC6_9VIRU|nr:MAG: hypothetical protein LCMAC201_03980 [Marseillevirus LCMAC201]